MLFLKNSKWLLLQLTLVLFLIKLLIENVGRRCFVQKKKAKSKTRNSRNDARESNYCQVLFDNFLKRIFLMILVKKVPV